MTDAPDSTDEHLMLAAYTLDALDDVERRTFERHLSTCLQCRAELPEFSETVSRLALLASAEPPASLRDRVLPKASQTRQLPPGPAANAGHRSQTTRSWAPRLLAGAAAVLFAATVALGGLALQWREDAQQARRVELLAVEMLTDPDREEVTTSFSNGGTATIVVAGDRAMVMATDVPEPPPGFCYQLWLFDAEGTPLPREVMIPTPAGYYVAMLEGVGEGTAVGVTVEPEGGSQAPTTDPVLMQPLPA